MNAPARQILSTSEAVYAPTLDSIFGNEDEMTRAARADIMALRDQATAAMRQACPEAAAILAETAKIATLNAMAPLSAKRLTLLKGALDLNIESARIIHRALS